jgi:hypothetical protein
MNLLYVNFFLPTGSVIVAHPVLWRTKNFERLVIPLTYINVWSTNLIFYFCLSCHVTSDKLVNHRVIID